jgi:hypothetical protein
VGRVHAELHVGTDHHHVLRPLDQDPPIPLRHQAWQRQVLSDKRVGDCSRGDCEVESSSRVGLTSAQMVELEA